jgi:hypothetical protein
MTRITFDQHDDEPCDDGWQPSMFGPGAESVLRQPALFPGGLDRGEPRERPRADQRLLPLD